MTFKERRREKRYSPDLTCTICPGGKSMPVLDVSVHGLSVLSNAHLVIGQYVDIQVNLDVVGWISVGAVVKNTTKMGCETRYGLEIATIPEPWTNFVYRLMYVSDK